MIVGKARSASVTARPQVGNAGQAIDQRRTVETCSTVAIPYSSSQRLDLRPPRRARGRSAGSTAGRSAGPGVPYFSKNARSPLTSRKSPSSLIRPFSTGMPRKSLPSPCSCQPRWSSTSVTGHRLRVGQRMAQVLLDLRPEGRQAPVVDDVLEPGPLAVGAVAEVAEDLEDRLADLRGRRRGRRSRAARPGTGTSSGARGRAQAAADQDVVADELAVLDDRQVAEVVGVDVGAVVFGQGEGRLELARAGTPCRRSARPGRRRRWGPGSARRRGRRVVDLLAVEPDVPVARRPRGDSATAKRSASACMRVADAVADRGGAAEDVALDVAAGRQGREQDLVDRAGSSASRSSLRTPWSWNSCRVVIRSVPLPTVRASSSQRQVLVGASACRPTIRTRTMNWYAFSFPSRFSCVRRSRSSCWYDPWNLRTVAASSLKCEVPLTTSSATIRLEVLAGQLDRLDLARLARAYTGACRWRCRPSRSTSTPNHQPSPHRTPPVTAERSVSA